MSEEAILKRIKFNNDGLVPVIAQQDDSSEVLMMAWMSQEAILMTLQTGYIHYFSRSRNKIWKKGETSGQVQKLVELLLDCDGDTIIAVVDQQGVACHTGRRTCFYFTAKNGEWVENQKPAISPEELYGK